MKRSHGKDTNTQERWYRAPIIDYTSSNTSETSLQSEASPFYTQAEVGGTWNSLQQKHSKNKNDFDTEKGGFDKRYTSNQANTGKDDPNTHYMHHKHKDSRQHQNHYRQERDHSTRENNKSKRLPKHQKQSTIRTFRNHRHKKDDHHVASTEDDFDYYKASQMNSPVSLVSDGDRYDMNSQAKESTTINENSKANKRINNDEKSQHFGENGLEQVYNAPTKHRTREQAIVSKENKDLQGEDDDVYEFDGCDDKLKQNTEDIYEVDAWDNTATAEDSSSYSHGFKKILLDKKSFRVQAQISPLTIQDNSRSPPEEEEIYHAEELSRANCAHTTGRSSAAQINYNSRKADVGYDNKIHESNFNQFRSMVNSKKNITELKSNLNKIRRHNINNDSACLSPSSKLRLERHRLQTLPDCSLTTEDNTIESEDAIDEMQVSGNWSSDKFQKQDIGISTNHDKNYSSSQYQQNYSLVGPRDRSLMSSHVSTKQSSSIPEKKVDQKYVSSFTEFHRHQSSNHNLQPIEEQPQEHQKQYGQWLNINLRQEEAQFQENDADSSKILNDRKNLPPLHPQSFKHIDNAPISKLNTINENSSDKHLIKSQSFPPTNFDLSQQENQSPKKVVRPLSSHLAPHKIAEKLGPGKSLIQQITTSCDSHVEKLISTGMISANGIPGQDLRMLIQIVGQLMQCNDNLKGQVEDLGEMLDISKDTEKVRNLQLQIQESRALAEQLKKDNDNLKSQIETSDSNVGTPKQSKNSQELKREIKNLIAQNKAATDKFEAKLKERHDVVSSLEKALTAQVSYQAELKQMNESMKEKVRIKEEEIENLRKKHEISQFSQNEKIGSSNDDSTVKASGKEKEFDNKLQESSKIIKGLKKQNRQLNEVLMRNNKCCDENGMKKKSGDRLLIDTENQNLFMENNDIPTNVNVTNCIVSEKESCSSISEKVSNADILMGMLLESFDLMYSDDCYDSGKISLLIKKLETAKKCMMETSDLEKSLEKSNLIIASMKKVIDDSNLAGQLNSKMKENSEKELELMKNKCREANSRAMQLEKLVKEFLHLAYDEGRPIEDIEQIASILNLKNEEKIALEHENEVLREKIQELAHNITVAQEENANDSNQYHEKQMELEVMKLKMKIEVGENLTNQKIKELSDTKDELRETDCKLKELERNFDILKSDACNKETRIDQLETLVKDYENIICSKDSLDKEVESLREKLRESDEIASQLPEFEALLRDYENLISSLRQDRIELDFEINTTKKELKDSISREADLNEKINNIEEKLKDYHQKSNQVEEVEEKLKDKESLIDHLKKEIEQSNVRNRSTEKKMQTKLDQLAEEKKQVVLYLNDQLRLMEEGKTRISEHKSIVKNFENTDAAHKRTIESQKKTIISLQSEISKLEQKILQCKKTIERLNKSSTGTYEDFTRKHKDLNEEISKLKSTIKREQENSNKIMNLQAQLDEAKAKLAHHEKVDGYKHNKNHKLIESLEQEILRSTNAKNEAEIQLRKKNLDLEQEKSTRRRIENELRDSKAKISSLEVDLELRSEKNCVNPVGSDVMSYNSIDSSLWLAPSNGESKVNKIRNIKTAATTKLHSSRNHTDGLENDSTTTYEIKPARDKKNHSDSNKNDLTSFLRNAESGDDLLKNFRSRRDTCNRRSEKRDDLNTRTPVTKNCGSIPSSVEIKSDTKRKIEIRSSQDTLERVKRIISETNFKR